MEKTMYYSENERLLATSKVGKLFARYAIPGAVSLVFLSLQSIIDGIVVGNFVGSDALAGVNLIMPLYSLLTSVALILGIGTQALMSIGFGERDYAKAKNTLITGFFSILTVSVLFALLVFAFASDIASVLGANEDLMAYSVGYIKGLIPFAPVIAVFFFFDYVLKALGHPRYAMGVMTSSILLNLILSLFFVIKLELGTFGVGLATGLAFSIGIFLSAFVVIRQLRFLTVLKEEKGRFSMKTLWNIFYNGSSEGVSEIAMGISLFIFNITLMKYAGKDGVAAFSVINYIIFIGTSMFLGISDGIISIISYNYGARLWDRIKQTLRIAVKTNLLIGVLFIIVLWVFGEAIISLFLDDADGTVAKMALEGAHILGFAFLLNGFNIFASSFFTALNNAKLSLIIAALRGMIFVIIGISIFPPLLGVRGIWLTTPFAELMTFSVSLILVRNVIRHKLKG